MMNEKIRVPALNDSGVVIPEFVVDKNIDFSRGHFPCIFNNMPTLAQLRHAHFGGSAEYRDSVIQTPEKGEWTSTVVQGDRCIERPDKINYRWEVEGGAVKPVKLPYDGWVLEYNKETGLPSRTGLYDKAREIFGDDASFFSYHDRDGDSLRIAPNVLFIARRMSMEGSGRFWVKLDRYEPSHIGTNTGVRMLY